MLIADQKVWTQLEGNRKIWKNIKVDRQFFVKIRKYEEINNKVKKIVRKCWIKALLTTKNISKISHYDTRTCLIHKRQLAGQMIIYSSQKIQSHGNLKSFSPYFDSISNGFSL